jgi:protocatechuate 3,4-dioxygenase beta subunit
MEVFSMMDDRQNILPATNEDTSGPYFPIYFRTPALENLTKVDDGIVGHPSGTPIILRGRVLDRYGDLAHGVIMEFWQANAKGKYRTPATANDPDIENWFHGFGRLRSASGAYEFRTILPGAVDGRAPNITITLFSDGISRIVTQMFFEHQRNNKTDPLLQYVGNDGQKLIAMHDGRTSKGEEVYVFDIIMAGDGETPFFDDLES